MKQLILNLTIAVMLQASIPILSQAQEGWADQSPSSLYPGILGIYAVDQENLWAVGELGLILRSTDGGDSWNPVPSGTTRNLYTVEFLNQDTGWVAGDDDFSASTVLRTTDGGGSWVAQSLSGGGAIPIYDLDFIRGPEEDSILGYITGGLGFTWKTRDLGDHWETVRNNCENTFYSSFFVNRDTGWFVGTPSVAEPYTIMRTTDGGESWEEQTNPTDQNLRGVCFGSDQQGIAVGLVGTLLHTSDGGITWEASPDGGSTRWQSVFLNRTGEAWAVGSKSAIAYSSDWGHTWVMQESGLSSEVELWEVYFIDGDEGWIVGGGIGQPGVILHTTNGGMTPGTGEARTRETSPLTVEQNIPNPFRSTTRFQYTIARPGLVRIEIYNAVGQHLETLHHQQMPAGSHEVEFNGKLHPPGIYYCCIEAGPFRNVQKMVLVK